MSRQLQFVNHNYSWVHPALELRESANGLGLFVKDRNIEQGEVVVGWTGRVVNYKDVLTLPADDQDFFFQIDEDLFQVPFVYGQREPADFVNHSCNPSCGLRGEAILVAMNRLHIGDEVTYDYAMSDCVDLVGWECNCGTPNCRGRVQGDDWKYRDELWLKYGDYFSPYLKLKRRKYLSDMNRATHSDGEADYHSHSELKIEESEM